MAFTTCPSEQQLKAFHLGDLPETSLDEVAEHLEKCNRCETLAQQLDTIVDSILAAIRTPTGQTALRDTRHLKPLPTPVGKSLEFSLNPDGYSFLLPAVEPDEIGRLGNYR